MHAQCHSLHMNFPQICLSNTIRTVDALAHDISTHLKPILSSMHPRIIPFDPQQFRGLLWCLCVGSDDLPLVTSRIFWELVLLPQVHPHLPDMCCSKEPCCCLSLGLGLGLLLCSDKGICLPCWAEVLAVVSGTADGFCSCLQDLVMLPMVATFIQCFGTAAETVFQCSSIETQRTFCPPTWAPCC